MSQPVPPPPARPKPSLVAALFDISFNQLVTRRLLGIAYAIALGLNLLVGVIALVTFTSNGGIGILIGLVGVPLLTLLSLLILRVIFEAVVVYFRGAEDLRALRDREANTLR